MSALSSLNSFNTPIVYNNRYEKRYLLCQILDFFKSGTYRQLGPVIIVDNNFLYNLHIYLIVNWLECFVYCFLYIVVSGRYLVRSGSSENRFNFWKVETLNNEQKVVVEIFNILVIFF